MVKKKKKEELKKKSGGTGLIVTVVAVCIAVFVFWAAQKNSKSWDVPDYLLGKWVTSAPAYQDRYLEFNKVSLIFATGPATVTEYFISTLTTTTTAKEISIIIESWDAQNVYYQFSLIYQEVNDGTLFFKNQPQIKWKKKPS